MKVKAFWAFLTTVILLSSCYSARTDVGFGGTGGVVTRFKQPTENKAVASTVPQIKNPESEVKTGLAEPIVAKQDVSKKANGKTKLVAIKKQLLQKMSVLGMAQTNKMRFKELRKAVKNLIPENGSDGGEWFLFIAFIVTGIGGLGGVLSADSYSAALGAIMLAYSLVLFLGLLGYSKLDECDDTLFTIGFWGSMFAFWTIIPLILLTIGLIRCDF